jgi:hypothetical protein
MRKCPVCFANILLIFILCLCLDEAIFAATETDLVMIIKKYFDNYYKTLSENEMIKSKKIVINELGAIIGLGQSCSIAQINKSINSRLNNLEKYINIFTVAGEDKLQCWFGEISEQRNGVEVVWDEAIKYTLRKMDKLIVHDYIYFSSKGTDALDAGVIGNTIYYNLEAYRTRAEEKWDSFYKTNTRVSVTKPYYSLRYNRLRKKLRYISWYPLYLECIESFSDLNEARKNFMIESINLMTNASLFHELGHIHYSRTYSMEDNVDSEIAAFLTELRYSPVPQESLDRVISAAYSSPMQVYNMAGREILSSFISYIQFEQTKGNRSYKRIIIHGKRLAKQIENLYRLSEGQIRQISEYIYTQRYR